MILPPHGSAEGSTYSSPQMFERRRRILREARGLLVERGLEGFSLRDLGQRAGVAQRTIYNAFGGKERVMAVAIQQYYNHFVGRLVQAHPIDTLDGVVERLICAHIRNVDIKNYVKAVVALYNSPTADPEIRGAMRRIGVEGLTPWLRRLSASGKIRRGIDYDELVDNLTNVQYMMLTAWCLDAIEEERFVFRLIEAFLLMAGGATRGSALAEINGWLADLHGPKIRFASAVEGARVALAAAGITSRDRRP